MYVRTKKIIFRVFFSSLYIGISLRRCQYGFGAGRGSKSRWDGWVFRSAVAANCVSPPYYYGGITRPTEPPPFFSQMPFAIKWQWWPYIRPISLQDIDFSLTKASVSQKTVIYSIYFVLSFDFFFLQEFSQRNFKAEIATECKENFQAKKKSKKAKIPGMSFQLALASLPPCDPEFVFRSFALIKELAGGKPWIFFAVWAAGTCVVKPFCSFRVWYVLSAFSRSSVGEFRDKGGKKVSGNRQ